MVCPPLLCAGSIVASFCSLLFRSGSWIFVSSCPLFATAVLVQLFLVPYTFLVFCYSRRCLSRWKHCNHCSKGSQVSACLSGAVRAGGSFFLAQACNCLAIALGPVLLESIFLTSLQMTLLHTQVLRTSELVHGPRQLCCNCTIPASWKVCLSSSPGSAVMSPRHLTSLGMSLFI